MIAPLRSTRVGKQRAGQGDEAGDIGVDDRVERLLLGVLQIAHRRGEPGIVEQQVDAAERFGKRGERRSEPIGVAHVEHQRVESVSDLRRQLVEPVTAAAGADDLPARSSELARRGGADSGGRAGDEGGLGHFSSSRSKIQSQAVGQSSIRAWACSAAGIAGASRGSATMCSR